MLGKYFKSWWLDGWKRGKERFEPHEPTTLPEIDDEIALLEIIIERRKTAAQLIELELERTTNTKKRITLITKLNTMDKQTYKDVQRINKLRDG